MNLRRSALVVAVALATVAVPVAAMSRREARSVSVIPTSAHEPATSVIASRVILVPGPQPLPAPAPTVPPSTVPGGPSPLPPHKNARFLVALGDSAAMWNGTRSYPYLIAVHLSHRIHGLTVEELAISGESTSTMRQGEQYTAALAFLKRHRGRVSLITIDIGGNDIVPCVLQGLIGPTGPCSVQVRATIRRNLSAMLRGLRAAARGVPIYGMTYYDPFLGNWLGGGAPRAQALATLPGLRLLNRELVALYGSRRTADVQGTFRSLNFSSRVASPWGLVPPAVARACTWLDISCHVGAAEGFGDDPNLAGAAAIAGAFERLIDRQRRD